VSRPTLPTARLRWQDDQPRSAEFGDIYHAADGAAEVERVFLGPLAFDARAAAAATAHTLRIGEIGFGTGLNFAVAADRFVALAPPSATLHWVSFEARPIDPGAFAALAARRARTLPCYRALAAQYPPPLPGWHRRRMAGGRVLLSLYLGTVEAGLDDLDGRMNAPFDGWLLDGFDPRRNPDCWSSTVIGGVARTATAGTGIATFTAAGAVRRTLEAAGFRMTRIDQRPHKRHTLAGRFDGDFAAARRPCRHVAVVGAGLAGITTCDALTQAGIHSTLIETHPARTHLPGIVLHTRLMADDRPVSRLRRAAYLDAADYYGWRGIAATGALHFCGPNLDRERMNRIADAFADAGPWLRRVDPSSASSLLGLPVSESALYFPGSRPLATDVLAAHVAAQVTVERRADTVIHIAADDDGVELTLEHGRLRADAVVVATNVVPECLAAAALEVLPVWGQLEVAAATPHLAMPVFGDGYFAPTSRQSLAIGASYEQRPWSESRARDFNITRAARFFTRITGRPADIRVIGSARGVRGIASDRLPVIGALAGSTRIYVNLAHGSNGSATAPMGAAIAAERLGGSFAPFTKAELATVAPERFAARQARRGYRHGARPPSAA